MNMDYRNKNFENHQANTIKIKFARTIVPVPPTDCMPKCQKTVVFVVKRYAVHHAQIRPYAVRKLEMKQYAVRKGGFSLENKYLPQAGPVGAYTPPTHHTQPTTAIQCLVTGFS